MLLNLRNLKDNPCRDFGIDPINYDKVDVLVTSIGEDGFWGGVVARKLNGHYEIAAGHHRVRAALKSGLKEADIFVGDIDAVGMIRIYARENATQRGNSSTAVAGSVASAIRYLAKAILTGDEHVSQICDTSDKGMEILRGQLASPKGLGEPIITRFLDGILKESSVAGELANLKASGDYARIIREVTAEIEEENAAAAAAEAEAETARQEAERKAAIAAEEREQRRIAAEQKAKEDAEKREADEAARMERKRAADAERAEAEAARKAAQEQKAAELAALRVAAAEAERKRLEQEQIKADLEREQRLARADEERITREEAAKIAAAEAAARDAARVEAARAEKAAKEAEELARKAKAQSDLTAVTFDFEGVAKHLDNAYQVRAFREAIKKMPTSHAIPLKAQEHLADEIKRAAEAGDEELSGAYVKRYIQDLYFTDLIRARDERLRGRAADLPNKTYHIILADPPWRYDHAPSGDPGRSIEANYPTMEMAELEKLQVQAISAPDCLLYMWTTSPKLAESLSLIERWGFSYRTCLVWVKDKIGTGYHARAQHEIVLIAKKGNMPPPAPEQRKSSVIFADRTEHSEKPSELHERIESAYPNFSKIELFSRAHRQGWDAYGFEAVDGRA